MDSTQNGGAAQRLNKPLVVALVGGLAVAAAIALNYFWPPAHDAGARRGASPPIAATDPATATPAPGLAAAPTFDVVRINPDGNVVMAGRAAPGGAVTILDGEAVIGAVEADENGEWVFVPEQPLAPGPRRLIVRGGGADGETSGAEDNVVVIVPEPGMDIAGRPAAPGAQALALRLAPDGAIASVMQAPTSAGEPPPVSIGAVDYGDTGTLTVLGRAAPGATVQLYVGNALAGRAQASAEGDWRITAETPLPADGFSLRADEVTAGGRVAARVAVPFSRLQDGTFEPGRAEKSIIVQPGTNLWRIARRTLGSGVAYTAIYDANKAQIVDPNLIFPGQVFSVPPGN